MKYLHQNCTRRTEILTSDGISTNFFFRDISANYSLYLIKAASSRVFHLWATPRTPYEYYFSNNRTFIEQKKKDETFFEDPFHFTQRHYDSSFDRELAEIFQFLITCYLYPLSRIFFYYSVFPLLLMMDKWNIVFSINQR